jgi:predicted membrane channel-forming protein YqfA (hemolysin III family)
MLCMNHNSATIINKWNHFTSSIFVVQCLWNCFSLICYYDISNSVVNLFLVYEVSDINCFSFSLSYHCSLVFIIVQNSFANKLMNVLRKLRPKRKSLIKFYNRVI